VVKFKLPKTSRLLKRTAWMLVVLCVALMAFPANIAAEPKRQEIPTSYQLVAENDTFQLHVDSATLAFKLLDKRNNYLWHSGIDELIDGDRLNRSWQAFAKSGISIEYLDEKAVNKRISMTNTEHILNVTPADQGIAGLLSFPAFGITLGIILQLEADGVRVEVPFSTIREDDPKFRLGLVYLYPFLGATRGGSTPGYMFLPDGTGSLIRFSDTSKAKSMFYGRYYGPDRGMIAATDYNPRLVVPNQISFPVFGMAHGENENAYVAVVEKGAGYGELQAHPASVITNFNFLVNTFIYNQSYFQATNRSGAGVTTVQRRTNAFDIVVHYRFLAGESANYVGMARSYKQYLLERGRLRQQDTSNPNIGIRLEFLGGDWESLLFWRRFIPMTTVPQIKGILERLQIPNPQVIYYGWQPSGATSMLPTWLNLEPALGSLDELRTLADFIQTQGGAFSLYFDPQAAIIGEAGYSARNDLAMSITNVNISNYDRSPNYYFTLEVLGQRYRAFANDVASKEKIGLALHTIGANLYSDFRNDPPLNRQETLEAYQALFADAALPLGFYQPNDYLFGVASAYYDMPLGDNGYVYTSEEVPFLPIVLAGHIPYYGPPLNFASNAREDLLRHVDFGIYPSYFLTHEATATMLNTQSFWIYTSSYEQWGTPIREAYQWMNALLSPVRGQQIINRQALAEGVFATTYANNRQIIVNYTERPFSHAGITIAAKDAALLEVKP
jgi:Family of unknown function (DUF5696)